MRWIIKLLLLAAVFPCAGARGQGAGEEFVGPFPSWKNVRADYGAVGDGRADDTAAIQKALDDLTLHKEFCVLYFPAGTYRITHTLQTVRHAHTEGMGMAVLGEDPDRAILKWDGDAGGTMLHFDAWYSRIGRLTLDGVGKAAIALQWGPAFSTYNETADMVFKDAQTGMQMGGGADGQAENAVLRCHFLRCTAAGLTTVNFNSMDIWAWFCRFEDCGYGMMNGAGNFHAYRNLFLRSKMADIGTKNLMVFSFIDNTSIGSNCFVDFRTGHTWGSPCSITGNRVIDPAGPAIRLTDGGPYLVVDNSIRSRPGAVGPALEMTWGDQVLVGNRYTVADPVKVNGRFRRIEEKVVTPAEIDSAPPVLPPTPINHHRRVFDVPVSANAAAIQAAIDSAVKLNGQRPVVHLPKGIYPIDQTLVVPARTDVQIVGDGAAETATVLNWTGRDGGVMFHLEGPARAVVRDLSLNAGRGTGILVTGCDQPRGLVSGSQLNLSGKSDNEEPRYGMLVNGLEQSDVDLLSQQGTSCGTWVDVIGGPHAGQGEETPGQVGVFTGATGTSDAQYGVQNGGRLVVRSVYHEVSGRSPQGILLNDSGSLSVDATRFSYATAADRPLVKVDNFRGDFGLFTEMLLPVNSNETAQVAISGSGKDAHVLCMANMFWENETVMAADDVWKDTSQPPAQAAMLLCNENIGHGPKGFAILDNRGMDDDALILRELRPIRRTHIRLPGDAPTGATDLLLHRVICTAGKDGIGIELRASESPK